MLILCPRCGKRTLYQTERFDECQECGYVEYAPDNLDNPERTENGDEA